MPKFKQSSASKIDKEKYLAQKKRHQQERDNLIRAARDAEEASRERELSGYREKVATRDNAFELQRQKHMEKLQQVVEGLKNPEGAAFMDWASTMLKLLAAAELLSKALGASDPNIFGRLLFNLSNIKDIFKSASLRADQITRGVHEAFFNDAGVYPQNFDPEFSVDATMENGRAFGNVYTGKEAEKVLFDESETGLTPADMYLAGYLKEHTDYRMVTDPRSSLFRKVLYAGNDKKIHADKTAEFFSKNPEELGRIQLSVDDKDLPQNVTDYQIKAKEFKKDPEWDGYIINAEVEYRENNNKKTKNIQIHVDDLQDMTKDGYTFKSTSDSNDDNLPIKCVLPAVSPVTSEQEFNNIIHNENAKVSFTDFCEQQMNASLANYDVKVDIDVDKNGVYDITHRYKLAGGSQKKLENIVENNKPHMGKDQLSKDANKLIQKLIDLRSDKEDKLLLLHENGTVVTPQNIDELNEPGKLKVVYANKLQLPDDKMIKNTVIEILKDAAVPENNIKKVDLKNGEVTFDDGGNEKKIAFTTEDLKGQSREVKVRIDNPAYKGEKTISTYRPLNAKELKTEFEPRLKTAFENKMKSLIGQADKKINLRAHSEPVPNSPSPK